ncbi:MAG: long-chain fatty acid transport protein [Cycloclasticus sp.]|nr:MAG: long-chain fatty acid transport protein [Cycloclasticus sp.]
MPTNKNISNFKLKLSKNIKMGNSKMRTFNKTPIALGVAAGMAMLVASTGAQAASAGTDLNLSAHTIAGGMAGAAYTRPQEASAAVFGNPATLTQFPGVNFNFGATLISLTDVQVETDTLLDVGGGGESSQTVVPFHVDHDSGADNYIVPTLGITLQVSPNLTLGLGLEADAGLGADYRDDPLQLYAGAVQGAEDAFGPLVGLELLDGPVAAPLLVEVISFNANIAAGYKVNDALSVGGALTIGFGLAQLGTAGPTTGFDAVSDLVIDGALGLGFVGDGVISNGGVLSNWGGSTSSVHDIGLGWSLGATYIVADGITTSLAVKSPVEYKFKNIIYGNPATTGGGLVPGNSENGWQHLDVEQPLEVIAGIAMEDGGLLVEMDVIWKNWSDADAYEYAYKDQFLVSLGTQYEAGNWSFRAGYVWAEEILQNTPESTLGQVTGVGNLPLGEGAAALDVATGLGIVEPLAVDFIEIVQMSLLPVIWEHSLTAGMGYNFTDAVSVNGFVSYSFGEEETRNLEVAAAALDIGLGLIDGANGGSGAFVSNGTQSSITQNMGSEIFVGIGINVALP